MFITLISLTLLCQIYAVRSQNPHDVISPSDVVNFPKLQPLQNSEISQIPQIQTLETPEPSQISPFQSLESPELPQIPQIQTLKTPVLSTISQIQTLQDPKLSRIPQFQPLERLELPQFQEKSETLPRRPDVLKPSVEASSQPFRAPQSERGLRSLPYRPSTWAKTPLNGVITPNKINTNLKSTIGSIKAIARARASVQPGTNVSVELELPLDKSSKQRRVFIDGATTSPRPPHELRDEEQINSLSSSIAAKFSDIREVRLAHEYHTVCTKVAGGVLAYFDSIRYNVDWIFYVTGQFNTTWYEHKKMVDNSLLRTKLPYGIRQVSADHRKAAIHDLCLQAAIASTNYTRTTQNKYLNLGPYTLMGLVYIATMDIVQKPYDNIPSAYLGLVKQCTDIVKELVYYNEDRGIDVEDLIVATLDFNPQFSYEKWCTLGISYALEQLKIGKDNFIANKMINAPVFDFSMKSIVPSSSLKRELIKDVLDSYYEFTGFMPESFLFYVDLH